MELDLLVDAMGPRRILEERPIVRTGEAVFRREREIWVVCGGFRKWKGKERERSLGVERRLK